LDVKLRGRELASEAEIELGRALRARVARGTLTVTVEDESGAPALDPERVRALHGALDQLRSELGLQQPVDLATIAAFVTAFGDRAAAPGRRGGAALAWEAIAPAVAQALDSLASTRHEEGARLALDLRVRTGALRELTEQLRAAAALQPARAAKRLDERLAALLRPGLALDPARLAQEVALLADRLDVTEEIVRLDTHLRSVDALLAGSDAEPVGRKLDFLCQELGRELSTIAAKSQDAAMSQLVVQGKAELEKIREQAQNIE
jgi:uncharacterized protein YicC (UPF0701 family)